MLGLNDLSVSWTLIEQFHIELLILEMYFLFRYLELKEKVLRAGGENAIARHTQRNKKVLVRDRLRMLLDDDDYLELSVLAGLGLPYGDIPSASCLTGILLNHQA